MTIELVDSGGTRRRVSRYLLEVPELGAWTAMVDVDSDAAISGKVTLTIDGVSWVGTVIKGDLYAGRVHAQIVGGAGKLAKALRTSEEVPDY